MTILLFLLVLVILIVVHELGHFFTAKLAVMRVDEFGIGYPPKAYTMFKKDGTEYTLNWLPFGGFVKIHGEDDSASGSPSPDSFASKPRIVQAIVLVAGIVMNIVFAWILISISLGLGMPRALSAEEAAVTPGSELVVSHILADSPAATAGLTPTDVIVSAERGDVVFTGTDAGAFTAFVASGEPESPITFTVERNGEVKTIEATPATGVVESDPSRYALGLGVAALGTVAVPWYEAPIQGALMTWELIKQVAVGLVAFFGSVFTLSADLSEVAGPVGIAGAVGDASATGIVALLTLTAVISINLALVNLLPLPALDGGRLLFVAIEAVTRKPIPQGAANIANTLGFAFLILLMVAVTASDIFKLLT